MQWCPWREFTKISFARHRAREAREQRRVAAGRRGVDRHDLLSAEAIEIVRPARLRASAAQALAAERLHTDDRTDHVAVDVDVADARRMREPQRAAVDARLNPQREAVAERVDLRDHCA